MKTDRATFLLFDDLQYSYGGGLKLGLQNIFIIVYFEMAEQNIFVVEALLYTVHLKDETISWLAAAVPLCRCPLAARTRA